MFAVRLHSCRLYILQRLSTLDFQIAWLLAHAVVDALKHRLVDRLFAIDQSI